MGNVLNDILPNQCTGCFLCQDVCNKKAIRIVLNEDGYYRPTIIEELCIDCGVCSKKCPAINDIRSSSHLEPRAYAAWNSNEDALKESSSGGLAYMLGEAFIKNSGVVYGVKWTEGKPIFGKAETIEQLADFRGSKYLQPIATGIYNEVKESIQHGQSVLFFGLPCHIRALKNHVTSNKLITVDILCAGIPSLLLWNGYCKWKFGEKQITKVNFRSKECGWRTSTVKCYSGEKVLLSEVNYKNRFFLGFNSTLFYNEACYNCRFNTLPRLGDITLGDYWGAPKDLDNKDGVSIVLANTKVGQDLITTLNVKDLVIYDISLKSALAGNYRINHAHRDMPEYRGEALMMLKENDFKKCSDKFFKPITLGTKIIRKIKCLLCK